MNFLLKAFALCGLFVLSSCVQFNSNEELRTVPVTNNPHVIPSQEGTFPGFPMPASQ
jgi:hypothetical protein